MKIFILGAGQMGAWLYRELKKDYDVSIWDKDKKRRDQIKDSFNLIPISDLKSLRPDLFINAVDLRNIQRGFLDVLPFLERDCIISDISTIKGDLDIFYSNCNFRFVSVHPMFGPHFANLSELQNNNAIIINESDKNGKLFFESFFDRLDVKIFEYSFTEHDKLMSTSLTLPFAASIAFSACSEDFTVPGTTYAAHYKIAKKMFFEDDFLLSEVLFNPGSIKQIENIVTQLEYLKHIIRGEDYDEAVLFFKSLRRKLNRGGKSIVL